MSDLEKQKLGQEDKEEFSNENENFSDSGSSNEAEKFNKYGYSRVRKKTDVKKRRQMC